MNLVVTHNGKPDGQVIATLRKQSRDLKKFRAGHMTEAQLRETPWLLIRKRDGKRTVASLSENDKQAAIDARAQIKGAARNPTLFVEYEAARQARLGVTVGALAGEWIASGYAYSKNEHRNPAQVERMKETLARALPFWDKKTWPSIDPLMMEDFALHCSKEVRKGKNYTGKRTTDIQLSCLSSLADWAMRTGRAKQNPFAVRETFQKAENVKHCHEKMPENDEQFHAVLSWLFTHRNVTTTNRYPADTMDRNERIAGAYLACQALTGLRPGEPLKLHRLEAVSEFPGNSALPGLIYPVANGARKMRVFRLKGGQSPSVLVTPALGGFLKVWERWLKANLPDAKMLFPCTTTVVRNCFDRACTALGLPAFKPHGMRSYYSRVERSQGADDIEIAVKLGQTTNGALIRSVYGDPDDESGGGQFDWLPKSGAPAWDLLNDAPDPKLLTVNFEKAA